jgi:hypothetical protein
MVISRTYSCTKSTHVLGDVFFNPIQRGTLLVDKHSQVTKHLCYLAHRSLNLLDGLVLRLHVCTYEMRRTAVRAVTLQPATLEYDRSAHHEECFQLTPP